MSHSKTRIWIHAILGVKCRDKLITTDIEKEIFNLLKTQLSQLNCSIKSINSTEDHIHILFLLNPKIPVSDIMKQIKGHVSYEINQRKLTQNRFSWQTGFGAFSVSEYNLDRTINYIQKQKDHHKKMSFKEEYDKFVSLYGIRDGV
ncbi:MAG: IS200/IS605 family transposase [Ignavibacteria bacterium]|nr:IS200/IS605 family transposase [Ignavibacteria bacterium]